MLYQVVRTTLPPRREVLMHEQLSHGPNGPLPPGTQAPDFSLRSTPDQAVSLSDFRGRIVILVFYPADWSPVCGSELALYNELFPEFQRFGATLLGISVDGAWCHIAYARESKLNFPLLADFEPKGAVARSYGVYRQHDGTSERALFVIDSECIIHWSYVSPVGVVPGADGILKALQTLTTKEKTHDTQSSV
jgi:peroxiredoxin